jgi:hypothetical protein
MRAKNASWREPPPPLLGARTGARMAGGDVVDAPPVAVSEEPQLARRTGAKAKIAAAAPRLISFMFGFPSAAKVGTGHA